MIAIAAAALVWIAGLGEAPTDEVAPPAAVPVELAEVETTRLEQTVRGVGTLRASETVPIRPQISEVVREIHFQEGTRVAAGQLLFELDDDKLHRELAAQQARVRAGEVRLRNARRAFNRQQQLFERRVISEEEFDAAQAERDSAQADLAAEQAQVQLLERRLQDKRIRAPFEGVIGERRVDRGAFVTMGDELATLYRTDPLELSFYVAERYIGQIQRGQRVDIRLAAYPYSFEGEVDFVSPALREATRDFLVKASIANPLDRLKPGAFATAEVVVEVREERPVVPEEALVATRTGYQVFVVDDDIAQPREVQIGIRRPGLVEIVAGVEPGEVVVRSGHQRLSRGDTVRAVGTDESSPVARTEPDTLAQPAP